MGVNRHFLLKKDENRLDEYVYNLLCGKDVPFLLLLVENSDRVILLRKFTWDRNPFDEIINSDVEEADEAESCVV